MEAERGRHVVRNLSMLAIGVFGVWGLVAPEAMTGAASGVMGRVLGSVGWMYLALCTGFLVLGAYLTLGRHGSVRLGADDARPEFSTPSWLTMLFAAGMGSGLVFWGVAEPVSHFAHPPADTLPSSAASARLAMVLANLHWGLHIWAIYAVCGLVIGYFSFRRGLPALISTPIRATLPRGRATRIIGIASDVIGVFAVVFGLAGSLVMGVLQVRSGLWEMYGLSPTTTSELDDASTVSVEETVGLR